MKRNKYKWIISIISMTIVTTIAVQCYWNYKNYKLNKQHFINQVQISLDNALESYYADLAERNHMTFVDVDSHNTDSLSISTDSISVKMLSLKHNDAFKNGYSKITQILDSGRGYTLTNTDKLTEVRVFKGKKAADSIKLVQGIKSIYISIQRDSLNFEKFNPFLVEELKRKQLQIPYALKHYTKSDTLITFNADIIKPNFLTTTSNSTFLKHNEVLELAYPNATKIILKQGLFGILLSFLLSFAIIASLIYLLKIIKSQKQLSEVKNDLISNITHEFKTPIATIGVALESIKDFNVLDDKQKTKKYINISNSQLSKLTVMVEKLLEIASLDSENLELNKDTLDINNLLLLLVEKHQMQAQHKILIFSSLAENITANVDVFHFENALNNIIDNAIKYGGNEIKVKLNKKNKHLELLIIDNGNTLTQSQATQIFEKFYRVPKGNTHDIKGFGIGLYYTKKIIEKHEGSISIELKDNTIFKIILPYA